MAAEARSRVLILGYEGEQFPARPFLHESIPLRRWTPRGDYGAPFVNQATPYGWHHQLFSESGEPREYAQTRRVGDDWRTRWIGRSWVTQAVDRSLRWLDRNASGQSGFVEMVWCQLARNRHVHLLRLIDSNLFVVASAGWDDGKAIWETDDRLRLLEESDVVTRLRQSIRPPG